MNALALAAQHVAHLDAEQPSHLADTFARELLDVQRRLEIALADNRRLVHRAERPTEIAQHVRIWPVHVRCDTPKCVSAVAFDPLPEEPQIVEALQALRWRTTEDGKHFCPRCRK